MDAQQCVKLTGTNRSFGLIPSHRMQRSEPVDDPGASTNTAINRSTALHRPENRRQNKASAFGAAHDCPVFSILHLPPFAFRRPGGHGEVINTRSHPELGRENPQRQWYCVLRRGRVGRRQVFRTQKNTTPPAKPHPYPEDSNQISDVGFRLTADLRLPPPAGWSSPVARQAHNLKVRGSNPLPATTNNPANSISWRGFAVWGRVRDANLCPAGVRF